MFGEDSEGGVRSALWVAPRGTRFRKAFFVFEKRKQRASDSHRVQVSGLRFEACGYVV